MYHCNMPNKLSWGEHIINTVSKAHKILLLIRQSLHCSSPFVEEATYYTMVRPKLEYCSSILDPYIYEHKNVFESLQLRAARFVCRDDRRHSHVSDMLGDLNLETSEDCIAIIRLTLLHKSIRNIVSINIDEHYAKHVKENIANRKSSSISFTHPTDKNNFYRYSFMPRTVFEWNLLPATMRKVPSVDTLKAREFSIRLSTHLTINKIAVCNVCSLNVACCFI